MSTPMAALSASTLLAWLQARQVSWSPDALLGQWGLHPSTPLPPPPEPLPNNAQALLSHLEDRLTQRPNQIFTPPPVAHWLAAQLDPTEPILDPAAGTGRLLLAVLEARGRTGLLAEQVLTTMERASGSRSKPRTIV
ncbi:MAG: hypothetical protein AAFX99_02445, partial [Myxococcota bacterium]